MKIKKDETAGKLQAAKDLAEETGMDIEEINCLTDLDDLDYLGLDDLDYLDGLNY